MVVVRGRARAAGVSRGRRRTGMCAVEPQGWRLGVPRETPAARARPRRSDRSRARTRRSMPAGIDGVFPRAMATTTSGLLDDRELRRFARLPGVVAPPAGAPGGVATVRPGRPGPGRRRRRSFPDRFREHRYRAPRRPESASCCGTPPKRVSKVTVSLPSLSARVAECDTLSTILPSFTCSFGTSTPSRRASTTRCGVKPLSTIHSCIARIRYGRCLVCVGEPATGVAPARTRSGSPGMRVARTPRPCSAGSAEWSRAA